MMRAHLLSTAVCLAVAMTSGCTYVSLTHFYDRVPAATPIAIDPIGGYLLLYWIDDQGVGGSAPRVNANRRPGEWQSYNIWFQGPRFDSAGKKTTDAKFLKVLQNGVSVQENVEVDGGTRAHMSIPEAATNPLMLQGDHGAVAFRNLYRRPLRKLIHA